MFSHAESLTPLDSFFKIPEFGDEAESGVRSLEFGVGAEV